MDTFTIKLASFRIIKMKHHLYFSYPIVLLVLLVLFSRKVIDYFAFLRLFWKKIISGSAMFLIILLLNLAIILFTNDRFIIVIFDVLVGAISYFTLCILLKESVMTSIIGMIKKKGDDKNE